MIHPDRPLRKERALLRNWKAYLTGLLATSALAAALIGLRGPASGPSPRDGGDRASRPAVAGAGGLFATLDSLGASILAPAAAQASAPAEALLVMQRDQSFYDAMRARGFAHDEIMALVEAVRPYRNLRRVGRGEVFRIVEAAGGGLARISFDLDEESYLTFTRQGSTFAVEERTHPVERRVVGLGGVVSASVYASLQEAAAPLVLAAKMNDILGWEVDFSRDLQRGDSFHVLYEQIWRNGQFLRTGPILALECVIGGRSYRAFRFEPKPGEPGYFNEKGANWQRQMLMAPLEYARVTSGFSLRRLHPIFKKVMPHYGVDYAAPVGTPVRAAGSGTIATAGHSGGAGRYVVLKHQHGGIETSYLHLSRFAEGIRAGASVKQGQVIGYVGASGWATGPHLDYRVRVNGRFVDPRRLKLPSADPVPAGLRSAFEAQLAICGPVLDGLAGAPAGRTVAVALGVKPPQASPLPLPLPPPLPGASPAPATATRPAGG